MKRALQEGILELDTLFSLLFTLVVISNVTVLNDSIAMLTAIAKCGSFCMCSLSAPICYPTCGSHT
jgi:hypothetical protein